MHKYIRCVGFQKIGASVAADEMAVSVTHGEKEKLQTQIFFKRKLGVELCLHAAPD